MLPTVFALNLTQQLYIERAKAGFVRSVRKSQGCHRKPVCDHL